MLITLTRSICLLGLLSAAFGPAYSYLALLLLYTRSWADTEAASSLAAYSMYLALLAANGILEAFCHAVSSGAQLRRTNAVLMGMAVGHILLSVVAVGRLGSLGLILADALNMVMRIAYCCAIISAHFSPLGLGSMASSPGVGPFSLQQLLPRIQVLSSLGLAFAMTGASQALLMPEAASAWGMVWAAILYGVEGIPMVAAVRALPFFARAAAHIGVGAACLAGVGAAVLGSDGDLLHRVRLLRRKMTKAVKHE
jgi:oligosaccharide translocation protein RFT1